jgi:hypothetical protein
MKKFAIVLIILVYGLSSTGAVVHLEYCCGKLSNISLVPAREDKKHCGGKTIESKSCCDSKQVLLKVKGEQLSVVKWVNVQKQLVVVIGTTPESYEVNVGYKPINAYSTGPPIYSSTVSLFLQHCHLTI